MNIPEKMKAAVLFDYNDLRVVEKPVPKPGKDEVLIRVKGLRNSRLATGWPLNPTRAAGTV